MNIKYSKEIKNWMLDNYPIKTRKECAEHLNLSSRAISYLAKRMGVKNSSPFTDFNIDLASPEFIYFLGFIWADGHVRKSGRKYIFAMVIQKEDADQLLPVFNKLGHFTIKNKINPHKKDTTSFATGNEKLGLFLFENDYIAKSKVEPTKILSKIPLHLQSYWWRGFFDGDGCVCFGTNSNYKALSFSGQYNYEWIEIGKILNSLKIKYKKIVRMSKSGNNSIIASFKGKDILSFFYYIYPLGYDNIGLLRKYSKFLKIKVRNLKIIKGGASIKVH